MTQKREHCQRDAHFDKAVRMLAEVVLPQPNFFPPSLHLMEKVLNVQPPESCAYHVCRNDCHSWDKIPKAAWPAHRDDTCPECGEGRFILTTPSGVSCLRPAKARSRSVQRRALMLLLFSGALFSQCASCWVSAKLCLQLSGSMRSHAHQAGKVCILSAGHGPQEMSQLLLPVS